MAALCMLLFALTLKLTLGWHADDGPPVLSGCAALKQAGFTSSGNYTIDPDDAGPLGPMPVECDMSVEPPKTIVHHDREIEQQAPYAGNVHCCCRSVASSVTYTGASYDQVRAVVEAHDTCEYTLWSVRCEAKGSDCDGWVGYPNTPYDQTHWTTYTDMCAPGQVIGTAGCGCQNGDGIVSSDSGRFTTNGKFFFPIEAFLWGDLEHETEYAFYTLGPLECVDVPGR